MLTFVFPGQGSQSKGMGEELFEEFQEYIEICDKVLGYSIKEICLTKNDKLNRTKYTQPALYVVNALFYYKEISERNIKPDFVVGHSLGEYNALLAAQVFDFETGLRLVQKRGELMDKAVNGKMAAVMNVKATDIRELLDSMGLQSIDIANYNSPGQIIISGMSEDINKAVEGFKDKNIRTVLLNTSGAFHSRYMKDAANEFEEFIETFIFNKPKISIISNYTAREYKQDNIKNYLVSQIFNSVKWEESIRYIMGKGNVEFKQIGPGNVAISLVNKIIKETTPLIIKDENVENKFIGNKNFIKDYNLKYAYIAGPMGKGISGYELVVKMSQSGFMSFIGTEGLSTASIKIIIDKLNSTNGMKAKWGMSLNYNTGDENIQTDLIDLFLKENIDLIQISSFYNVTIELLRYKLKGIHKNGNDIVTPNKIILKTSRRDVAKLFLKPASEELLNKMKDMGLITDDEAYMASKISVADEICVEGTSAGETGIVGFNSLLGDIINLKEEISKEYNYKNDIRVGVAGGIGTFRDVLTAFIIGADFVMTGSINQCTVEANTSDEAKLLLQNTDVYDTEIISSSNVFDIGVKVQVLKKGVLFPIRANKLNEVYKYFESIDKKIIKQIEKVYFKKSVEDIYEEIKHKYSEEKRFKAESDEKYKLALVIKRYYDMSQDAAIMGYKNNKANYQILSSAAMGAFNQMVRGTKLEKWENRHVNEIAEYLMKEALNKA